MSATDPIPLLAADTGEVMAYACPRCRNVMSEGYACGGYAPNDPTRRSHPGAAEECCRCKCGAVTGPLRGECDACRAKEQPARDAEAAKWEAAEEDDAALFALRVGESMKHTLYFITVTGMRDGLGYVAFPLALEDVPREVDERLEGIDWYERNGGADFGRGKTPEEALANLRTRAQAARGGEEAPHG